MHVSVSSGSGNSMDECNHSTQIEGKGHLLHYLNPIAPPEKGAIRWQHFPAALRVLVAKACFKSDLLPVLAGNSGAMASVAKLEADGSAAPPDKSHATNGAPAENGASAEVKAEKKAKKVCVCHINVSAIA